MTTLIGWALLAAGVVSVSAQGWQLIRLRTDQRFHGSGSSAWKRWYWPWNDENWSPAGQRVADRAFTYGLIGFFALLLGGTLLLVSGQK